MIENRYFPLLVSVLLFDAAGCETGPKLYTVTGSVTFQNQPVAKGQIVFADAGDAAAAAVGQIENGRYSVQTTAGAKIVRITASKETGRILEGAMGAKVPELIDLIPPQYNTASSLRRTVEAKPEQSIDFPLE